MSVRIFPNWVEPFWTEAVSVQRLLSHSRPPGLLLGKPSGSHSWSCEDPSGLGGRGIGGTESLATARLEWLQQTSRLWQREREILHGHAQEEFKRKRKIPLEENGHGQDHRTAKLFKEPQKGNKTKLTSVVWMWQCSQEVVTLWSDGAFWRDDGKEGQEVPRPWRGVWSLCSSSSPLSLLSGREWLCSTTHVSHKALLLYRPETRQPITERSF